MPWNATGQTAGGVNLDSDGVTIHVTQAGSYYIDYYVSVNYNPDTPGGDRDLGLFINGWKFPTIKRDLEFLITKPIAMVVPLFLVDLLYSSQLMLLFN